ncbi:hypothetical protein MHH52_21590 [Paenibacillus sp. FSL K6-0276]|uniref:hypothetical protein n=1 Tax=Paenibacillus sp. FSL K6-0276 TaxID=2921450 RepID=UPI0030EE60F5
MTGSEAPAAKSQRGFFFLPIIHLALRLGYSCISSILQPSALTFDSAYFNNLQNLFIIYTKTKALSKAL